MIDWIRDRVAGMDFNGWEAFGLLGEGLFFARMLAQWIASERVRRPVIPMVYWVLSLLGAAIVLVYALHKQSWVLLLPQLLGGVFYARGLGLEAAHRRRERERARRGFDRPDYPWPRITALVPAHNEAEHLAATLTRLLDAARAYPGPTVRIVVAANACDDDTEGVARVALRDWPDAHVVADARGGMSFGKNLAATAADDGLWVFVDADTTLTPDGLTALAEAVDGIDRPIGTMAGRPDRGGGVVRTCFWIANRLTRKRNAHAPGGVMFMTRTVFASTGGFDETLPQGTSTDFIQRAMARGAQYVFVDTPKATTSIRRFEQTGVIRQMMQWARNHRDMERGNRHAIRTRPYDNIR